jgi:hypothetical protein
MEGEDEGDEPDSSSLEGVVPSTGEPIMNPAAAVGVGVGVGVGVAVAVGVGVGVGLSAGSAYFL